MVYGPPFFIDHLPTTCHSNRVEQEIRQSTVEAPPKYNVDTEAVDPMLVLEDAYNSTRSIQAQCKRDPYYTAASLAYDKFRFDHRLIGVLHGLLITLAQYRFWAGKKTTRDFAIQEALRIGKEMLDDGVQFDTSPIEIYRFSIKALKLTNDQLYGKSQPKTILS